MPGKRGRHNDQYVAANESSKPISGPISDRWTRFNSSGRFGAIEWADSVDPSDKAGYVSWLPNEDGQVAPRNRTLNPGDEIKIKRFIAVGQSPAHALGVVSAKLGKTGRLKLKITDTNLKPVPTASVDFRLQESIIRGYPDEAGKIEIQLPVGSWKVSCSDIGRQKQEFALEIKDDQTVDKSISMNDQSGIRFSLKKEDGSTTPCKVQFIGMEETPAPKLGPGDRAHGSKDQYHSEKGNFSVALDPGKYKLIVTRGIEHDISRNRLVLMAIASFSSQAADVGWERLSQSLYPQRRQCLWNRGSTHQFGCRTYRIRPHHRT